MDRISHSSYTTTQFILCPFSPLMRGGGCPWINTPFFSFLPDHVHLPYSDHILISFSTIWIDIILSLPLPLNIIYLIQMFLFTQLPSPSQPPQQILLNNFSHQFNPNSLPQLYTLGTLSLREPSHLIYDHSNHLTCSAFIAEAPLTHTPFLLTSVIHPTLSRFLTAL